MTIGILRTYKQINIQCLFFVDWTFKSYKFIGILRSFVEVDIELS